jgi:hypothetical protein
MFLARYFVVVGGILLALLYASDAYLPKSPMPDGSATDMPTIRISSDQKWPQRLVFDTSLPVVQTTLAGAAPAAPAVNSELLAKAHLREAFAQLPAHEGEPKQPVAADSKKSHASLPRKPRVARRHAAPPMVLVAQQPQFGFFGTSTW